MADREDWPRGAFGGNDMAVTSSNAERAEHHPRPDITDNVISQWAEDRADDAGALARRIMALTCELAAMKADRPYIIGCLHGWDAAVEGGQAHPSPATAEHLTAWLSMGPTEMGDEPAIFMDSPVGGDPLILATMKRVHREDMLHAALRGTDLSATVQWMGILAAANNVIDGLKAQIDASPTDNTALAEFFDWIKLHKGSVLDRMTRREIGEFTAAFSMAQAALASRETAAPARQDACARPDCPSGDGLICPDCAKREGGA